MKKTRNEDDEILIGRVRKIAISVNGMTDDAMKTMLKLGRRGAYAGSPRGHVFFNIVFEEAMLALEEFAHKHGHVPWQPRFEIAVGTWRNCAGEEKHGCLPARRPERLRDFQAAEKMLAEIEKRSETPPPSPKA